MVQRLFFAIITQRSLKFTKISVNVAQYLQSLPVRWDWLAKILVFVWGPQKSKNHSIHFYVSDEFSTFIKMARHTVSAPKTPITEFLVSPHDGKNMPILSTVTVPYSDNNCWVFSKKNKTRLKIRPKKRLPGGNMQLGDYTTRPTGVTKLIGSSILDGIQNRCWWMNESTRKA